MAFERLPRATVEGEEKSPPTLRPGSYNPKQTYSHAEMIKHPLTMEDLLHKQRLEREIKERRVVKPATMDDTSIEAAPKGYRVPPSSFFNQTAVETPDEHEIPTERFPSTEPVPDTEPVPSTEPSPQTMPASAPIETPSSPPASGVREKDQDTIVISARGTIKTNNSPPSASSM